MDGGRSPGSLIGEAIGAVGNTAKTLGDEAKKAGQSAGGQIAGSNQPSVPKPQAPDTAAPKSSGGKHYSLLEELKKVGQSAGAQISGHTDSGNQVGDIDSMKKHDDDSSKVEFESIRARVDQIYREHAQKRAAEEQSKREAVLKEQEKKEQKRAEIRQLKKIEPPNPAVAKTRAEIKNYGAE